MYTQDDLYLIIDFLEDQLDNIRESVDDECSIGSGEEETMCEFTIKVIKSLIKE